MFLLAAITQTQKDAATVNVRDSTVSNVLISPSRMSHQLSEARALLLTLFVHVASADSSVVASEAPEDMCPSQHAFS